MTRGRLIPVLPLWCILAAGAVPAGAHDGPPYPIASNQVVGPYRISVWTDPDATDDGSKGGRFWVLLDTTSGDPLPADVRGLVTIRPLDRPGEAESMKTEAVDGDRSRQYVELLMNHEGRFAVHLEVESAAGEATLDSQVQATYDLRPPRFMLVIYLVPFLLVGSLWAKLLVRRRRSHARRSS